MLVRTAKRSTAPLLYGVAGVILFLLGWQFLAYGPMNGTALPYVHDAFRTLVAMFAATDFWLQVAITTLTALIGLIISIVLGVGLGIIIGTSESLRYATSAVLEFIKPVPPIVVLPIAVLVLGPTTEMTIVLVSLGCAVPIMMQTISGVFDVDPVRIATARSYGMGANEILWRVILPSASPFIATAIRVASPTALMVTVVAGLLGGGPGLGQSLYQAQTAGDPPRIYALIVVLGVLGLLFQVISQFVESKVLHWHESQQEAAV